MNGIQKFVGDENRMMLALVSVNFSAAAVSHFIQNFTPYLNAGLVFGQLIIAAFAVVHLVKKSLKYHDKKKVKRLRRNRVTRNARRVRDTDSQEG